ncbi:MAG: UDP-N-acetylmuramoyl-tripeptide--D-alanyl-D-alanine ligase [Schleiferiaceae bacterium]|nr:UDP-N-acetylmuramoyl-tripeptide--D-alanyl-D-alanine ligase [Schleiferiaceae bacterium]MDR9442329.1 UDP-N-acetylmuramoyl-tripeptide--D-alanyl-D-alanine ligase [Schleiferiaceae bacterium]
MPTLTQLYQLYQRARGVSTDTRRLKPGALFIALQGENYDGNRFLEQALEKGALAAIGSAEHPNLDAYYQVAQPLETLQELARLHRRQLSIPVIGLTGSNGKTTSKELLVSTLQQKFRVGATQGNLNNHIGVPLTILNLPEEAEVAVIEMGANHQQEIAFLSRIAQPDHGFITNYGKAHLAGFGGVEGIVKGKSELYHFLAESHGTAWVHREDDRQMEKSQIVSQRYFYGEHPQAHYHLKRLGTNERGQLKVVFEGLEIQSGLTGSYNFSNLAVAAALSRHLGLSPLQVKQGLEQYRPQNNRSQLEEVGGNLLYRDYYNANPDSMEGALESLELLAHPQKWVVLGDMFELGAETHQEHQAIAERLKKLSLEQVILVGEAFAQTTPPSGAHQFATTEEAVRFMEEAQPQNKLILIKGSRGMHLEDVAAVLGVARS